MYEELSNRDIGDITVKANWQTPGAISIMNENGSLDSYQCFIYHDGEWHLYAPYIVEDGAWDLY